MRTAERARSERDQRGASETPWPLPLRGLLAEARTAEISGVMAAVFDNWTSTGTSIEMRQGYQIVDAAQAKQRIPFEFVEPEYLNIFSDRIEVGALSYSRAFPSDVSHTFISSNVIMADGAGPILRYDGTSIVEAEFTTDTGKDASEFNGVFAHHDRVYLWDDSELAFYYGDIGAVMGEVVRFPLDRLGKITGKITFISAATINASHGTNDILVIMTSTGMMILYEGLNPGDPNDWRLLGRVKVASPVSKFAIAAYGPDLWVLTTRGIVSVRDSLANGRMALSSSVAEPISDLIADDVAAFKGNQGWQLHPSEDGGHFFVNVPTGDGYKQYTYDTESRSWSTSDYPARWWHDIDGYTQFTHADGQACEPRDGGDIDQDITAKFHTSWIRLPRHSEISFLIPTIIAEGPLEVIITVLTDHNETQGDIDQAKQVITLRPENAGDEVALNEIIGVNAAGRVFQARFEVTGRNVRFENLLAGLS